MLQSRRSNVECECGRARGRIDSSRRQPQRPCSTITREYCLCSLVRTRVASGAAAAAASTADARTRDASRAPDAARLREHLGPRRRHQRVDAQTLARRTYTLDSRH